MADKEIKIGFPEEKMEALLFFIEKRGETVEEELKAYLDKAYEKNVPQQVRNFVESRMVSEEVIQEPEEVTTRQRRERRSAETAEESTGRRTGRQSRRAAQAEIPSEEVGERMAEIELEEVEESQGQGMMMGM